MKAWLDDMIKINDFPGSILKSCLQTQVKQLLQEKLKLSVFLFSINTDL